MSITDRKITPALDELFRQLDRENGPARSIEEDWPIDEPAHQDPPSPLSLSEQLEIAESEFRKAGGWRKLPWGDYAGGNRSAEGILELRRQLAAERERYLDRAMDDLGADYPHGDE